MAEAELLQARNLIRDLRAELYSTRNALKEAQSQFEGCKNQMGLVQQQAAADQARSKQLTAVEVSLRERDIALQKALQEVKVLRGALLTS